MAEQNSPLGGFSFPEGPVTIAEVPFLTQINIRKEPDPSLPLSAGTSSRSGDVDILWLGPDEWLAVGPPGGFSEHRWEGSVVDVSAQRTTIALGGPHVREILALGCATDLHPSVFPVGACVQTTLAHAPVIILRRESDFWVLVRASFANHLAGWLVDASREFAVEALP
ncbi:sarcosine oxidase subunit gamma [Actinoplanes sp. CA-015351]|uniref:sarcosine oxidase subunit gamma n=1 Tax=Actinoplanes sp. CA-015351 TaxID=3239897 RepID=UPI003D9843D2